MIPHCTQVSSSGLQFFLQYFFLPVLVALIAYYLFGKFDEYKKRKKYSILGAELLLLLIEEVETGYNIIKETFKEKVGSGDNIKMAIHPAFYVERPDSLPNKSWNGINTITEEVLLRIFEVSNGKPDEGFPSKEIRIHTKNYFETTVKDWERLRDKWPEDQRSCNFETIIVETQNDGVTTENVLKMLYNVRSLLEENAKRCFPK